MTIIILFLMAVVTFLCLGMMGNCLNIMKNVKKEKDNERTPRIHTKQRVP